MRKRIKNPDNESQYVDIPVIYQAKFSCAADQHQEAWLYFDNSLNSSRQTRVQRVENISNSSQYCMVERIISFNCKTMAEQAQESTFYLTNTDPPPIQKDGRNNPAHEQVHYVRYFYNNDSSSKIYVDVELIDTLKLSDIGQEWIYYMRHPTPGEPVPNNNCPYFATIGYCDPTLPMAPDGT